MKSIKYLSICFENGEFCKVESKFILDFSYKKSFKIDKYDSKKELLSLEAIADDCKICFCLNNSFLKSVNVFNFITIISRIQQDNICYYELFDKNNELFERIYVPYYFHRYKSLQTNDFEIRLNGDYHITISH